ncbi:hypothetical protein PO909_033828 [Leuciscus waleckii]
MGPFQVLLITHTAVKVGERATWVNASHCRRVPSISGEQQEEEPRRQTTTTTTAKPLVLPGPPEIERASGEELAWMRDEGTSKGQTETI